MGEWLQLINIGLTSGVLVTIIGAAIKYGRLTQQVDGHEKRITRVEDRVFGDPK